MNKNIKNLYQTILNLKDLEEARIFFRDLSTEQEILEFSKRWQVARMLANKKSYSVIEKKTGLSSTTVARISKWLSKGKGGYRLMLDRLNSHHNSISSSRRN
jgi:TrpR-related protein YerC/YecD